MIRGTRGLLPPPIDDIESFWSPAEKMQASRMLACSVVGGPATVRAGIAAFIRETGVDELMIVSAIHDQGARLRSYGIVADIMGDVGSELRAVA